MKNVCIENDCIALATWRVRVYTNDGKAPKNLVLCDLHARQQTSIALDKMRTVLAVPLIEALYAAYT